MAIFYVRSTDGSNADNGSTWALAKATIAGAISVASPGDTIYVSQSHAETQASALTLDFGSGGIDTPIRVICANDGAQPPTAVATSATVSCTGANNMTIQGTAYIYGINFKAGDTTNQASITIRESGGPRTFFDNCIFTLNNSNASSRIFVGTGTIFIDLLTKDCSFVFGSTSQFVNSSGPQWTMLGGSVAATGSVPTTFLSNTGDSSYIAFRGVNFSAITGTLIAMGTTNRPKFELIDCKLGSGVTLSSPDSNAAGQYLKVWNSDSGTQNYRFHLATFGGVATSDTTTIVTGGAGASDGTTTFSHKVVTTSAVSLYFPYVSEPISVWNDITGASQVLSIEFAGASTLKDDEIWMEVEYLGSSTSPLASRVSSRKATLLTAAANVPTSSASWNGSPAVKQKMSVTLTPQMKGEHVVRIYIAKASYTCYINPKVDVV